VWRIDLKRFEREVGKASAALAALACGLVLGGWMTGPTLLMAAEQSLFGKYRDENLAAIRAGTAAAASLSQSNTPGSCADTLERSVS
jgi:hypothetical protein